MLGALLIVFREVLEAGLIVGIVMAATRGVPGRGRWITIGIAGGVLGAGIVAMFAGVISDAFQGSGQELFNAGVLGDRRRHADVAQRLDGAPWPRDRRRNAARGHGGE